MDRSPMRAAAVACVIAGGLLMGGAGAVAFADPGSPDNGSTTDGTIEPRTTNQRGDSPYKRPRVGPVPVPKFHIPSRLGPMPMPGARKPPRLGPITLPGITNPSGTITFPGLGQSGQTAGDAKPPTGDQPPSETAPVELDKNPVTSPPPISFVPLVPSGVPVGPSVTIKNPLPDSLPVDLHQPIVPQVLPPPIVALVAGIAEQVPLADIILNDLTLPPLLSDWILPTLLSDIVIPTMPLNGIFPGVPVPTTPLNSPETLSLTGSVAPPAELAPTGVDVALEPAPEPSPLPAPPVTDQPPHLNAAPPPESGVTQLSEPVEFRAGYSDYLRDAGMAQIAALAVPGAAAILLFTVGGGFIGYRQARAGHVIRAEGITRFLR